MQQIESILNDSNCRESEQYLIKSNDSVASISDEEEEKWAGRNVTEKEGHVPRPPKEPVEEKRRREADKRKATKIAQHSLDLDGKLIVARNYNTKTILYICHNAHMRTKSRQHLD